MQNTIRPTYDELIKLNPLLSDKTKEGVEELIDLLEGHGYYWNEKKKSFLNKKSGVEIRTRGLDVFVNNKERFARAHKTWADSEFATGMRFGQKYIPKLFILLIINVIFGWLFIPIKFWISSLIFLIVAIFIFRQIAHKKIRK